MTWVNIIAIIILVFSFLGGLKEVVIKQFFSLLALVIAIPVTGLFYYLLATVLAFLPGTDWENFLGFFITMAVISIILHLIFLLPRKIIQAIWKGGVLFRLFGGILNVVNAGIGMVVFALVLRAYPVIDWLEQVVLNASVMVWLVEHFTFVQAMLPELFRKATSLL